MHTFISTFSKQLTKMTVKKLKRHSPSTAKRARIRRCQRKLKAKHSEKNKTQCSKQKKSFKKKSVLQNLRERKYGICEMTAGLCKKGTFREHRRALMYYKHDSRNENIKEKNDNRRNLLE